MKKNNRVFSEGFAKVKRFDSYLRIINIPWIHLSLSVLVFFFLSLFNSTIYLSIYLSIYLNGDAKLF